MLSRSEFAYLITHKGWYYVLTKVNPDSLEDAALGEALMDAQDAFSVLLRQAPQVEADPEDEELDEEDFQGHVTDFSLFDDDLDDL